MEAYHVETQSALSLGFEHDHVHYAHCTLSVTARQLGRAQPTSQHILIPGQNLLIGHLGRPSTLIDQDTIRIDNTVGGDISRVIRSDEFHIGGELAINRTRESDSAIITTQVSIYSVTPLPTLRTHSPIRPRTLGDGAPSYGDSGRSGREHGPPAANWQR